MIRFSLQRLPCVYWAICAAPYAPAPKVPLNRPMRPAPSISDPPTFLVPQPLLCHILLQWHCVVGSDFKAQFTHESKTFFFVSVGKTNVLLFRTT